MPELERLHGLRVVADPSALDAARWHGRDVTVLRFAPDDAFGIGAETVSVDDEHAIVEAEAGYVGAWLAVGDLEPHLEWPLPAERPALAQGAIAGVPGKVWLPADRPDDGPGTDPDAGPGTDPDAGPGADPDDVPGTRRADERALVLTAAAYAAELAGRLR